MKLTYHDDLKERVATEVLLWAYFAAIIVLCVVMVAGLYYWSNYAPIFAPAGGGPATEQIIPW
jgi:hypothetical protein